MIKEAWSESRWFREARKDSKKYDLNPKQYGRNKKRRLESITVENMNEYFELSLKHLVNVFDGEDVIQDEHLGFMIDFITAVKEIK